MRIHEVILENKPFSNKQWRYTYISHISDGMMFLRCVESERADIFNLSIEESISDDYFIVDENS